MAAFVKHLALASDGSWTLSFGATSSDEFDDVLDELKLRIPPDAREWEPDRRCWWIESDYWLRQLRGLLPGLDAAMAAARGTRAGAGTSQRLSHSAVPSNVQQAFDALHLLPSAPAELVGAARRILARTSHPDHGGKHAVMVGINRAADTAQEWAERHAPARTGGVA